MSRLVLTRKGSENLETSAVTNHLLPYVSQAVFRARCMLPPSVLRSIHHLLSPADGGPGMYLRRRHVV